MNISIFQLTENLTNILSSALNDWGSIHPAVIHLPIVLLLIAPFFIASTFLFKKQQRTLAISAMVLMVIGTLSIFLATSTGDSAAEPLEPTSSEMVSTLTAHVNLAEQARLSFSILTILFFLYILFQSKIDQKFSQKLITVGLALYLLVYGFNLIILFNAAHYGGELVHKHKISSTLYSNPN